MFRRLLLITLLLSSTLFASAQTPAPPPADPDYTLHVYADRIQFAALILDDDANPVPNLDRQSILLSLDSGKPFHPTDVHPESDDPIAMAVLFEDAGSQTKYLNEFTKQFAQLAPSLLLPQDSLRLYAVDCGLAQTNATFSSPTTLQLEEAINNLRASHALRPAGPHHNCNNSSPPLLGSMAIVAQWLGKQHGRRVLLVVTQGDEDHSKPTWQQIKEYTSTQGIAVFGYRDRWRYYANHFGISRLIQNSPHPDAFATDEASDNLLSIASGSGGVVMAAEPQDAAKDIADTFRLLRARYIVSFPRPHHGFEGTHSIAIESPRRDATTLRITGATAPIIPQEQLDDPHAVPSEDSPAIIGKRHPH
ncbi:MAG: hypothetical protein PW792_03650 [Acidobacteriaceae bacterium]|nr:hypothetical protein [Acidobacteriaceae bacterium]